MWYQENFRVRWNACARRSAFFYFVRQDDKDENSKMLNWWQNTHFKGGSKYQFLSGKYIITGKGFSFTGYLPVCKIRYKRFWCVRLNDGLNQVSEIYCSSLTHSLSLEITHETESVWKNWFRKVNLQREMLFVYDLWHVSHGWGFLIKMSFCSSMMLLCGTFGPAAIQTCDSIVQALFKLYEIQCTEHREHRTLEPLRDDVMAQKVEKLNP